MEVGPETPPQRFGRDAPRGDSAYFGGKPGGCVSWTNGKQHFFVSLESKRHGHCAEHRSFSVSKHGSKDTAERAAREFRARRSLERRETRNRVRWSRKRAGVMVMCLTREQKMRFDATDYPIISRATWRALSTRTALWYAQGKYGEKQEYLHRVLLPHADMIDHIDGNGLNNLRSNLRPADHKLNSNNMSMCSRNTSGVNGVYWHKRRYAWIVHWYEDGKAKRKYCNVRPPDDEQAKAYRFREAVAFRDEVYARIGNCNGIRPKRCDA